MKRSDPASLLFLYVLANHLQNARLTFFSKKVISRKLGGNEEKP